MASVTNPAMAEASRVVVTDYSQRPERSSPTLILFLRSGLDPQLCPEGEVELPLAATEIHRLMALTRP